MLRQFLRAKLVVSIFAFSIYSLSAAATTTPTVATPTATVQNSKRSPQKIPPQKSLPQKKTLAQALALYKQGNYDDTMEVLNKIRGNRKIKATVHYWKGLVHSKQQKYDLAILNFEKASKMRAMAEDLYYQLGQSYYAAQRLRRAITAFRKSILLRKHKAQASAFYIGYIHQLRDKNKNALSYYKRISRLKRDPDKVKQPALYQTAEIYFDRVKKIKNERERIAKLMKIRSLYVHAYNYDKESLSGKEAQNRIDFIDKQKTKFTHNKAWRLKVEQDIRYDSNVINKADNAILQTSSQSSMVSKTTGRAYYSKGLSDKWSFNGNTKLSAKFHTERNEPEIIESDAIIYALGFSFDQKNDVLTKNAHHNFGLDLNYTMQDHRQSDNVAFFSRYFQFSFAETLQILEAGPSAFSLAYKYYDHHLPTSSNVQFIFSYNQKSKLTETAQLSTTLQGTWLYGKQSSADSIRYELNNRLPILLDGTDLTLISYLGLSVLDTRRNQPARGWEKKINFSVMLRKNIKRENHYLIKLGWDFTRNLSQDTLNHQYSRHQVFINGAYRF